MYTETQKIDRVENLESEIKNIEQLGCEKCERKEATKKVTFKWKDGFSKNQQTVYFKYI